MLRTIRSVLNVGTLDNLTGCGQQCRTDPEVGVSTVCELLRWEDELVDVRDKERIS